MRDEPPPSAVDKPPSWEHFSHDADIGVRGRGNTLAEAFEHAAMALMAVMTDPNTVQPLEQIELSCEAPHVELLFVDWLNALIYEMATRGMVFNRFSVRLDGLKLSAAAWGESVDVSRHHPAVEIKGATYTDLHVFCDENGQWIAQCVVDV